MPSGYLHLYSDTLQGNNKQTGCKADMFNINNHQIINLLLLNVCAQRFTNTCIKVLKKNFV